MKAIKSASTIDRTCRRQSSSAFRCRKSTSIFRSRRALLHCCNPVSSQKRFTFRWDLYWTLPVPCVTVGFPGANTIRRVAPAIAKNRRLKVPDSNVVFQTDHIIIRSRARHRLLLMMVAQLDARLLQARNIHRTALTHVKIRLRIVAQRSISM